MLLVAVQRLQPRAHEARVAACQLACRDLRRAKLLLLVQRLLLGVLDGLVQERAQRRVHVAARGLEQRQRLGARDAAARLQLAHGALRQVAAQHERRREAWHGARHGVVVGYVLFICGSDIGSRTLRSLPVRVRRGRMGAAGWGPLACRAAHALLLLHSRLAAAVPAPQAARLTRPPPQAAAGAARRRGPPQEQPVRESGRRRS